jgi:hypothetical protein
MFGEFPIFIFLSGIVSGAKSVGEIWWRGRHVINSFVVLEFDIQGRKPRWFNATEGGILSQYIE